MYRGGEGGGHEKHSGEHFLVFMELITRGGRGSWCKVLTFDGQERATKIEEVQTKEEFWSFGDNEIVESCPHSMKRCLPSGKSKYQKFQHLVKANLILLANTPIPGQCTNSWLCSVSRRVATRRPVIFAVGWLNLHWGHIYAIIYK